MQRSFASGDSVTIFTAHTHCLSMMSLNNKESKMAGRGKSMSVSAVQDIYSPVSLTPGPEMPTLHTL